MNDARSNELVDERTMYRLKKIEAEKERQRKKYQQKIESIDWLSRLNVKEEEGGYKQRMP